MISHGLKPVGLGFKGLYFLSWPGLGMSNMNFLIADVIKFSSHTKISFSQGCVTKIESMQFSEFGSRTICAKFQCCSPYATACRFQIHLKFILRMRTKGSVQISKEN